MSRKIQLPKSELRILNLAISANELVTGWWKGRQLGLIKFSAGAGERYAAVYALKWAARRGWGLDPEATPARYLQAIKELKNSPSSLGNRGLALFLAGTQAAMSLGWIINYLFSMRCAFPQSCEFRRDQEVTSSDNEEAEAKRRKPEEAGFEGSGLPK